MVADQSSHRRYVITAWRISCAKAKGLKPSWFTSAITSITQVVSVRLKSSLKSKNAPSAGSPTTMVSEKIEKSSNSVRKDELVVDPNLVAYHHPLSPWLTMKANLRRPWLTHCKGPRQLPRLTIWITQPQLCWIMRVLWRARWSNSISCLTIIALGMTILALIEAFVTWVIVYG